MCTHQKFHSLQGIILSSVLLFLRGPTIVCAQSWQAIWPTGYTVMLAKGPLPSLDIGSLKQRAAAGDSGAKAELGLRTMNGIGGAIRNPDEARILLQEAANNGEASAENNLGFMDYMGMGMVGGRDKAFAHFLKSANLGSPEGQANVGCMYLRGWGVPKNPKEALRWNESAVRAGISLAQYNLGMMYKTGEGVRLDLKKAKILFELAANQENFAAQNELGIMFMNGIPEPKDYDKALILFRRASKQGWPMADFNLGLMYEQGLGLPPDINEAIRFFTKAAEGGDKSAQLTLANIYDKGLGVPINASRALVWYEEAASKSDEAKKRVSELKAQGVQEPESSESRKVSSDPGEALENAISKREKNICHDSLLELDYNCVWIETPEKYRDDESVRYPDRVAVYVPPFPLSFSTPDIRHTLVSLATTSSAFLQGRRVPIALMSNSDETLKKVTQTAEKREKICLEPTACTILMQTNHDNVIVDSCTVYKTGDSFSLPFDCLPLIESEGGSVFFQVPTSNFPVVTPPTGGSDLQPEHLFVVRGKGVVLALGTVVSALDRALTHSTLGFSTGRLRRGTGLIANRLQEPSQVFSTTFERVSIRIDIYSEQGRYVPTAGIVAGPANSAQEYELEWTVMVELSKQNTMDDRFWRRANLTEQKMYEHWVVQALKTELTATQIVVQ